MSRSRKKLPIAGSTTAQSEKADKQRSSRSNRRTNKAILQKAKYQFLEDLDHLVMELPKETASIWSFSKDGKRYYHYNDIADMERLLRK